MWEIKIDIPGLTLPKVSVLLKGNMLTVEGERMVKNIKYYIFLGFIFRVVITLTS